ncbi:YqiA/YcfP family alpha/beta fold hydrolase [Marinifilum caeruleilacunae]|uniref:Alpha/beta hydrolase n=1 Tax=Marinifilum caeruleilacunae TaxID=2499076 RepID=A0ABX1X0W6_9BACT|nr:YqiA/YcfP family alpha/beta fold hydrolase [Marinifilum caeruleilacunae]NOU62051.1 alpha/beta hydrolase [Marinifilum caeruleilacunae]
MKVIFSHGKESGPWGTKIKHLAEIAKNYDCQVDSLDYRAYSNPDDRVYQLQNYLKSEEEDFILVGSSMGGYVSLVASQQVEPKAIFLMAPALYLEGYSIQEYATSCENIEIVHGKSDEVIPYEHSLRYAKQAKCNLHLIEGDHRLTSSIEQVEAIFEKFLLKVLELKSVD